MGPTELTFSWWAEGVVLTPGTLDPTWKWDLTLKTLHEEMEKEIEWLFLI